MGTSSSRIIFLAALVISNIAICTKCFGALLDDESQPKLKDDIFFDRINELSRGQAWTGNLRRSGRTIK